MNTTQLMHSTLSTQEQQPYVMSGVIDIYNDSIQSVGIVLVHDVEDENIDLIKIVREYLSFGVQKLYLVNSDGSKASDDITYKYPNVVSLSFGDEDEEIQKVFSLGYILNIAFEKINTDIVFLSWTNINPFGMSSCLLNHKIEDFPLCVMPVFENADGSIIPTTFYPKKSLNKYRAMLHKDNPLYPYSLFPFKGVGIYNRDKFLELGGFDAHILDLYSQLFEFGIRAYSYNMKIRLSPYYRVRLNDTCEIDLENKVLYDLICIKAGIGSKFIHSVKFFLINIRAFKCTIELLKIFGDKNYRYKNKIPAMIKEYWKT